MLVLGLTGNIGCGKSSISNIFQSNDIDVIDADIISRKIFEDKVLLEEVFEKFGDSIKNSDKTLNRKALGNIVFNDEIKLKQLNELTHPKIYNKIINEVNKIKNKKKAVVVIDGALLIEGRYLNVVDKLLVITCNINQQINRIQNRDKCTIEEAMSRINSQMAQDDKVKYADYIIDNSQSLEELEKKAKCFIKYMKENWYA